MIAKANQHGVPSRRRPLRSAACLLALSLAACGGRSAANQGESSNAGSAGNTSSGGTAPHPGGSSGAAIGGAASGGAGNPGASAGASAAGTATRGPPDSGTGGSAGDTSQCPPGTFTTPMNPTCTAWTVCTPGSFVSAEGTTLSDRECTPCPSGQTSTVQNATACQPNGVIQIAAGERHTCALSADGSVKCWGNSSVGQLGYGNTKAIGNNQLPSSVGSVSITTLPSVTVKQLVAGAQHTCALLSDDSARCWGSNNDGEVGVGNIRNQGGGPTNQFIGDDELPSSIPPVSVTTTPGVKVKQLAGGDYHTCALLSDDRVQCWGVGGDGQLGNGSNVDIGRDELPSSVGSISVGAPSGVKVSQIVAGGYHTCALLSDGTAKCWGNNAAGQLGYGNTDGYAPPSSLGPVSISAIPGVKVQQLAAGWYHTCALLSDSSVKCWGDSSCGELGYGNTETIGDDELPASVGPVSVTNTPGVKVIQIAARGAHTCALLSDGSAKCWGASSLQNPCLSTAGELGYGNTETIGDDELPSSLGPISISADPSVTVGQLALGLRDTCALLSNGAVECWGYGKFGQLGYGNTNNVGDDELPSAVGAISLF